MQLIRPILKTVTPTDSRIVSTLRTKNEIFGELVVDTRIHEDGYNRLISEIKNRMGKTLGEEIFSIDNKNKTMFGYLIETLPEYRQKGYGFGELMRLSSIITMIENNIQKLKITSKNTAINFHKKYKFQPAEIASTAPKKYLDMELTTQDIIENKNFFNELFKKHGIDYEI